MLKVLYYCTGLVHLRQLAALQKVTPQNTYYPLLHPAIAQAMPAEELGKFKHFKVAENNSFKEEVWRVRPDIILMRMLMPTPWRLQLLWGARTRGIPVVAWEEVNQVALNEWFVNNYVLPVDQLAVCSAFEKEAFIAKGFSSQRVTPVGSLLEPLADSSQEEPPQVLVSIGSLHHHHPASLETLADTQKMIRILDQAFGPEFTLILKPHPAEKLETYEDLISEFPLNRVQLADPNTPFTKLLMKAEYLVNRGRSQTLLEAIISNKKIIVMQLGISSRFQQDLPQVCANNVAEVDQVIRAYKTKEISFKKFKEKHLSLVGTDKVLKKISKLLQQCAKNPSDPLENIRWLTAASVYTDQIDQINVELAHQDPLLNKWLEQFKKHLLPDDFLTYLSNLPAGLEKQFWIAYIIKALAQDKIKANRTILTIVAQFDTNLTPFYFLKEKKILKRLLLQNLFFKSYLKIR